MNNIILTGMAGAGKSTLGAQLAKTLKLDFVDTDVLIQISEKEALYKILKDRGFLKWKEIEENILLKLDLQNHVIATGGSAIYSEAGMLKLKSLGTVIFLDVPLDELLNRIGDYSHRGIASDPNKRFADIYAERLPLYKEYADRIIDCGTQFQSEILEELLRSVQSDGT